MTVRTGKAALPTPPLGGSAPAPSPDPGPALGGGASLLSVH